MSLGGVSNVGTNGNFQQGQGANAGGESSGKEFSLEKQQAGASKAALITADKAKQLRGKTTQIVDRKKRNRKGAPRTILVDGEIYEVFLLAIA
jgi:hypothetical protein